MKLYENKCEMTCTLTLTERETEMLGYLTGFGAPALAEAIGANLTTKFPKQQWETLWSELRDQLEASHKRMKDTRAVFHGQKVATRAAQPGESAKEGQP